MKPRDLLHSHLSTTVVPHLMARGFRFATSRQCFSRTVGYARQEIAFCLDRRNTEDSCGFWTVWGVRAPVYKKWHRETFGEDPPNDGLGGLSDWNIPGWSRAAHEWATLTNSDREDQMVMLQLIRDIDDSGLPFLERISTWEGAAQQLVSEGWMYDRAADFLMIAGLRDRAHEILLEGVRHLNVAGRSGLVDELPRLRARLGLFFNE